MRVYTVQPGDTPSSIAARDDMAGCPKCAKDLVQANPHRASVQRDNGYLTFRDPLVVGEQLWLPDKWFDGTLDRLSRAYFDGLPADPTIGLGQLPPEHVPQLYEVQLGDTEQTIALKFGQLDTAATMALADANPSLPTTTKADGTKTLCSLAVGQVIVLPDRWFAAGSTWSAVRPGCNPPPQDVAATPAAVAQLADQNHPPPKNITLAVHPDAIDKMQAASGGSRDPASTAAKVAASTSAVAGSAVVGTFIARMATGIAYDRVYDYFEDLF